MKYLRQWGIIIGLCFAGELVNKLFKLPIPGNVIGMILLFLLLLSGIVKLEMVEETGNFLLDHLAFFFVPAGVGLMACNTLLSGNWIAFLSILLITTILVIIMTGHAVQILMKIRKR